MSGHNKWSKIKNRKAVTDKVKSKIFSKMARLIAVASREVGGDTNSPTLRSILEKARGYNMPASNIERAVKKGIGGDTEGLEAITYEAYGPGGVALIIEVLTANRNKAVQDVKLILSKHELNLALPGSVTWAFVRDGREWKPTTTITLSEEDTKNLEKLIEELDENDEVQDVYTNAD